MPEPAPSQEPPEAELAARLADPVWRLTGLLHYIRP